MPRINTGPIEVLENLRPSRTKDGTIEFECPLCRSAGRISVSSSENPLTGTPGWWGGLGFSRPVRCPNGHEIMVSGGIARPPVATDHDGEPRVAREPKATNREMRVNSLFAQTFMDEARPWLASLTDLGTIRRLTLKSAGIFGRPGPVEIAFEENLADSDAVESSLLRLAQSAADNVADGGPFSRGYALLAYFEKTPNQPHTRVIRIGGQSP